MHQLTESEMEELTGAKFAGKQIEVLMENGIPFFVNANRRPVTTWDAINRALADGGRRKGPDASGFNLEAAR